ncbi:MAG: beta strand repeat-containing protein, partial [Pikeienuella sp.]
MRPRPLLEKLEDRILLTAEPTVSIEGPEGGSVDPGAENVPFTITFDNASPTDVGFAPFVNVLLPTNGADGVDPAEIDDGVTFDSATFLGTPIVPVELVFDENGEAVHPLAVDANGDPLIITGVEGDTLLVFALPFGSFAPDQAPVEIEMFLDFSPLADLDQALTIEVVGGFQLGNDELDNPDVDPSILGDAAGASTDVTPTVLTVTKLNDGAESETATGPNFPRTWTINVEVAPGQTLEDVVVSDILPTNIHYLGNLQVTGASAFTVIEEPTIGQVVQPGDNSLVIEFDEVTGDDNVAGANDVQITFDYFVDQFAADGSDVIDPTTGDDAAAENDVRVEGDFVPLDPRDAPVRLVADDLAVDDTLDLRSIAVQKTFVVSDDQNVAGPTPGDTLTFSLDVQISDFFTMADITLTDVLGDGLEFAGNVQFTVNEADGDSIALTGFDAAALTVTDDTPGLGQTTVVFDLSAAMLAEGAADGILVGDLVDGVQSSGTTVTITYDALIENAFADPGDEEQVSQGDAVNNDVTVRAEVRDNNDRNTATGVFEEDTSSAGFEIPFGEIESKTVVAINGAAPGAELVIIPGDTVTFAVTYVAPVGAFEDLTLDDFLPLPVFDSAEITTFTPNGGAGSAVPPVAGTAQFGAGTSAEFFNQGGVDPTISIDGVSNAVSFDFGTFSADPRQEIEIEILFSVTVQDVVFADGLLLTNQATTSEQNTSDAPVSTTAIAQFVFTQPELDITKGVVAAESDGAIQGDVGPVGFSGPGTAGQRADAPITSVGIAETPIDAGDPAGTPIDADITGVDAGDIVTFAIVVENTGDAPNGAFNVQIQDTLPAGFEIPGTGLNLDVRLGDGTAIAFTDLGGGIFGSGIELNDDNVNGVGSLAAFDKNSGENIAIITYDLVVSNTAGPQEQIDNTAEVTNFAAFEAGDNRVDPNAPITDDASASTDDPTVDKSIFTTSIGNDDSNQLLIGEVVTYEIVIELTEGTTEDVVLRDRINFANNANDPDRGFIELLDAEVISIGANLTLENAFAVGDGPSTGPEDRNSDGVDDQLFFDFGDVLNTADNIVDDGDRIVVHVTALVLDVPQTVGGDLYNNQARLSYEGENIQNGQGVRVRESDLSIEKTVDPVVADAGDTVTFRVEIENDVLRVNGADRSASAFDLVLTDLIDDPDLLFQAGTVVLNGDAAGAAVIDLGNGGGDTTIQITLDELAAGDNLIIEYQAIVADDASLGDDLVNTAAVTYDSLPTDDDPNERDYSLSDDAQVALTAPDLEKNIRSTDFVETVGDELAIGEIVVFEIIATIPEGSAPIIISDTLPTTPGTLTFISAVIEDIGDDLEATSALNEGDTAVPVGGVISFDFGTLENAPDADDLGETITILVTARVDDIADNADGDVLVNSATLSFSPDPADIITDTASVTIVEPSLAIDKTAPAGPVDAGDIVPFQLDIVNSGTGPAFDIDVSDFLTDAGLVLVPGSVVTNDAGAVIAEIDDGFRVTVDTLDAGATLTITYNATVQDVLLFNTEVNNTATIERFDSNPGDDAGDETRAVVFDPLNPDNDLTDSETIPAVGVELTKITSDAATDFVDTDGTSFDPANPDVAIGETVVYTLTVAVPEGQAILSLTDDLPAGLIALSAEVTNIDAGVATANIAQGDDDASAFISINGGGDEVVFDFGLVTSTGVDDPAGVGDLRVIEIEVTAQVQDVAAAFDGAALTNTATLSVLDPADGVTELTAPVVATETIDVVEPSLTIDKIAPADAVDAGDVISFTVNVENTGGGPAFDVVVTDFLTDVGVILTPGSVNVVGATGVTVTEIGDGFRVNADVIAPGDTMQITYTAVVQQDIDFIQNFTNTATIEAFDSNPSDDPADVSRDVVFDPLNPDPVLFDTENFATPGVELAKVTSEAATDQGET